MTIRSTDTVSLTLMLAVWPTLREVGRRPAAELFPAHRIQLHMFAE